MTATDYRMTRRNIFIGAAAFLICAPAIVRATSLMPVRSLPLPALNPLGEFYRRCFYRNLDFDLRAGRRMSLTSNGKIVSEAEARRMVSYARAQGWLPTREFLISGVRLINAGEIFCTHRTLPGSSTILVPAITIPWQGWHLRASSCAF